MSRVGLDLSWVAQQAREKTCGLPSMSSSSSLEACSMPDKFNFVNFKHLDSDESELENQ